MSLPLGSASGIERTEACAASVVLPRIARASEPEAERGTSIHNFARAVLAGAPRDKALAAVTEPAWRETCEHLDLTRLGGDLHDVRSEVAYALDVVGRTARELGVNIARGYTGIGDVELPGSCDIEGTRFDDVPVVLDIKTGWEPVAPCAENPQIMFFAWVRMLLTGAPAVEGRIAYVREDGSVRLDSHTFERFDLECFADGLEEMAGLVIATRRAYAAGATVQVARGSHCRYCEAMPFCPAFTQLARTMATDLVDVRASIAELTPAQAGVAWSKAKAVETLLEEVLDALKERARLAPIPTPEGKLVKAIPMKGREFFDTQAAIAMLRAKGATADEVGTLYRVGPPGEQIRAVNPPKTRRGRAA